MGTLQDYYDTGDNGSDSAYSNYWAAQTFTAGDSYNILIVSLKLWRWNSPGTVTVSIRAVDGSGFPTGSDIDGVTGTTNGNTLTTGTTGEWREITLSSAVSLTSGTEYAIVIRATSGNITNRVYWRYDSPTSSYVDGVKHSSNSGSSWADYGGSQDFMFRTYDDYSFSPPYDIVTYKRLVAAAANKIWYESI